MKITVKAEILKENEHRFLIINGNMIRVDKIVSITANSDHECPSTVITECDKWIKTSFDSEQLISLIKKTENAFIETEIEMRNEF